MSQYLYSEFHRSYNDCVAHPDFFQAFYDCLMGTSPEVAGLFDETNMVHQRRALKMSLYLAGTLVSTPSRAESAKYFRGLGHRHAQLSLSSHHYEDWLDCLVATVRAFDVTFSTLTEEAWRHVMGDIISTMLERTA